MCVVSIKIIKNERLRTIKINIICTFDVIVFQKRYSFGNLTKIHKAPKGVKFFSKKIATVFIVINYKRSHDFTRTWLLFKHEYDKKNPDITFLIM